MAILTRTIDKAHALDINIPNETCKMPGQFLVYRTLEAGWTYETHLV